VRSQPHPGEWGRAPLACFPVPVVGCVYPLLPKWGNAPPAPFFPAVGRAHLPSSPYADVRG